MFAKLELGIIFETLEEASVCASRFFQVKRICVGLWKNKSIPN